MQQLRSPGSRVVRGALLGRAQTADVAVDDVQDVIEIRDATAT
jgi:hypothetical protein